MQNSSLFQIYNTTVSSNRRSFILIYSKISSIIGILLIPIVLACLSITYYFYKRYINTKFHQQIKQNDTMDIDEKSNIIRIEENDTSVKDEFIQEKKEF